VAGLLDLLKNIITAPDSKSTLRPDHLERIRKSRFIQQNPQMLGRALEEAQKVAAPGRHPDSLLIFLRSLEE
jgi:hypothetical protein